MAKEEELYFIQNRIRRFFERSITNGCVFSFPAIYVQRIPRFMLVPCAIHRGTIGPALSNGFDAARRKAYQVRWSNAIDSVRANQSHFQRWVPNMRWFKTVSTSSLTIVSHVFSCPPSRFRQTCEGRTSEKRLYSFERANSLSFQLGIWIHQGFPAACTQIWG